MSRTHMLSRAFQWLLASVLIAVAGPMAAGEPACRTGAVAVADVFVLANPMYALYFGDLAVYLNANRARFRVEGDAIRCAGALSRAFMGSAVKLYDPVDVQRRQALDARMRANGINPGPQQPTASSMMFAMSMQLSRLARVLPAAAEGNYGPMNTATTELEQMQIFAESMLRVLIQDPTIRAMFASLEPLIREAAQFDHNFIRVAAERLGNAP